jgi:hypothetical protein
VHQAEQDHELQDQEHKQLSEPRPGLGSELNASKKSHQSRMMGQEDVVDEEAEEFKALLTEKLK